MVRRGARTVVFLPGAVTPAEIGYGDLVKELGDRVRPLLMDPELYAAERPPRGWGYDVEAAALFALADREGLRRIDAVGFSLGAETLLCAVALRPERFRSLALVEPEVTGAPWPPEDRRDVESIQRSLRTLPPQEAVASFLPRLVKPGVEAHLPAEWETSPPPWLARRHAAAALWAGLYDARFDQTRLASFRGPVHLALGEGSAPRFERAARKLAGMFPHAELEVYPGAHHVHPPHRASPSRYAAALRRLWERADRGDST